MTKQIIQIIAHSSDRNDITLSTDDGISDCIYLTDHTHGYVPAGIQIGGGDYIRLSIDVDTGKIENWNSTAVKAQLARFIDQDDLS